MPCWKKQQTSPALHCLPTHWMPGAPELEAAALDAATLDAATLDAATLDAATLELDAPPPDVDELVGPLADEELDVEPCEEVVVEPPLPPELKRLSAVPRPPHATATKPSAAQAGTT